MTVRLIPLGVGEAFTALHYTICLALGVDDTWLLVDCPHPVRKMLREASLAAGIPLDLDRISGVALSHLHADHCSGLEDYGFYSYYALGRRAAILRPPRGVGPALGRPARRRAWARCAAARARHRSARRSTTTSSWSR